MDSSSLVRYRIDIEDRFTEFNDAWLVFAAANDGHALHPSSIHGRSLWDFLTDDTTTQLYRQMVRRVRQGGTPMRFRFRCDSPDRRRLLAMEVTGGTDGSVQFTVTPVLEQQRPSISWIEPIDPHVGAFITMCAWCKQVRLPSELWVEVEEATKVLELFEGAPVHITHGICPSCFEAVDDAIGDAVIGAAGTVTLGAIQ